MPNLSWSFAQIWNESLEQKPDWEVKPRDYLWASDLGKAPIDTYLRMLGTPFSNPMDSRAKCKMEAGNLHEWIIGLVLRRAGILQEAQRRVEFQYPGLLSVHGKLDYDAGGKPDWEKAKQEIIGLELPEFFGRATEKIIEYFKQKYPNGLELTILEIKSCSARKFDVYTRNGPAENHVSQTFHYVIGEGRKEAHIVYSCRDDLRMLELPVMRDDVVAEGIYKSEIELLTKYYNAKEQPPKEKEIIFDEKEGKFNLNWKISYSPYITLVYGFKDQNDFESKERGFKASVGRWNRVLGRAVADKGLTDDNKLALEEMQSYGFDSISVLERTKLARLGTDEEESETND